MRVNRIADEQSRKKRASELTKRFEETEKKAKEEWDKMPPEEQENYLQKSRHLRERMQSGTPNQE